MVRNGLFVMVPEAQAVGLAVALPPVTVGETVDPPSPGDGEEEVEGVEAGVMVGAREGVVSWMGEGVAASRREGEGEEEGLTGRGVSVEWLKGVRVGVRVGVREPPPPPPPPGGVWEASKGVAVGGAGVGEGLRVSAVALSTVGVPGGPGESVGFLGEKVEEGVLVGYDNVPAAGAGGD